MDKVYHGDCLEVMDNLIKEGVKVDAIITDPPYGITACKWDNIIDFDEMWKRLNLLKKERTPIVLFGSEPFSSALRMSNIKEYKYDWVWEKGKASNFLTIKTQPLKNYENVIVFNGGVYNYQPTILSENGIKRNNRGRNIDRKRKDDGVFGDLSKLKVKNYNGIKVGYPKSIIKFNSEANNQYKKQVFHPTQKPVKLMEYLIKTYTDEGGLVLDFAAGSGSTGLACKNLNRNYIMIEQEKKYIDIINERLNV
jgi:site-specific DNA-methyltransferase (adenine-specific)